MLITENPIIESTSKNYLKLFSNTGEVHVEKTINFIDMSLTELAEAFRFTKDQVRLERMSPRVIAKIKELAGALEMVAEVFNGNEEKTKFWINTPNPNFGGSAPRDIILRGRFAKVQSFILAAKKLVGSAEKK